jgi:predicted acylesterase/phospholipase RssA
MFPGKSCDLNAAREKTASVALLWFDDVAGRRLSFIASRAQNSREFKPAVNRPMDASAIFPRPNGSRLPQVVDQIALVPQGGGALDAYRTGVYEALHESGPEPDWVAGVSIGGIDSAIVPGNPREARFDRLREFRETITSGRLWPFTLGGEDPHKSRDVG